MLPLLLLVGLVHGSLLPSTLRVTPPSRREILAACAAACAAPPAHAAKELQLTTSASGLKWVDIRPGVGPVNLPGQRITIDYMMSKSAAGGKSRHTTSI